ncbi:MAG TPA: hypothetical protein VN696_15340 [Pyrinomonadaceae bacterium]|nr:hypothetical protein [Pyrinomonadaceae bacterium]
MRKTVSALCGATLLALTLAVVSFGQVQTTTVTKTQAVQNPDGTYTIVEYPVGKETIVTLNPVGIPGAAGTATILRAADGTTIKVNLTGLPADMTAVNLYAVDPTGAVTLLGPVTVASGVGTSTISTPLSRFMLFSSTEDALTTYGADTHVLFRSAVPQGLTVIPIANAVGETVAAVAGPTSEYAVPMLGIPTFKKGDDTKLKINFSGPMEGARANIFIEPHKRTNASEVRMVFHDLKEAPKNTAYILWAVSPDNQYQNLGQIVNVKGRNEAEIKSDVSFPDFGLLLTSEPLGATTTTIIKPSGHRIGVIQLVP